jgi:proteasome accessory factor B
VSFLLGAHKPISWPEIRAAFPGDYLGASEASDIRKFERDKAELVELGIPLEWVPAAVGGGRGGYRLDRRLYYLPDLDLDPQERALLSTAGAAALEQPSFPLREDLLRALEKLFFSTHFPHRSLEPPRRGSGREAQALELLGRAVVSQRRVEIAYRSYVGERTERVVAPYGLTFRSGTWFLVGHCLLRDAIRTFSVERIDAARALDGEQAAFVVPADFDLAAHVGHEAWQLALHPRRRIHLVAQPALAPLAKNLFSAPGSGADEVVEAEDGTLRISLLATNADAIARLALRHYPHLEIVAPPSLAAQVEEALERIRLLHEGSPAQKALRVVAKSGATVEEIAREVGLAPEELIEELDRLRMVGRPPFSPADMVDVDVVEGRVHATLPQGFTKPPALTPTEAAALDAAASALAAEGGAPLQAVREKIRLAVPAPIRERFDAVAGRLQVAGLGLRQEVARLVDQGIEGRRELSFQYFSAARGEATQRRVRPLRRFLHQGQWYLYAYCCERRDRRLFRLDRGSEFRLEEATFLPRPSDEAPFRGVEGSGLATLRIGPGPWAEPGYLWRLGAREVQPVPGGGALATFPFDQPAYAISVVLSLGGEAEVLGPASLRQAVYEATRAGGGTSSPPAGSS